MIHVDSEFMAWVVNILLVLGAFELLWSIGFVIYKLYVRIRYNEIVELTTIYYSAKYEEEES